MTFQTGDRVKETTTTTGTGAVTLAGAAANHRAFSDVAANGDEIAYAIVHQSANEWEVGLGVWNTGGTLTRSRILASSNAGAAVNLSAGTKDVFNTLHAQQGALPATRRSLLSGYAYIPAGEAVYSPGRFEIGAAAQLELAADAVLEV